MVGEWRYRETSAVGSDEMGRGSCVDVVGDDVGGRMKGYFERDGGNPL